MILVAQQVHARDAINLPDFGDSTGQLISPEEEQKFGQQFFQYITQKAPLNRDLQVQEYIETLGQRLLHSSDLTKTPFHFFVVMDPAINAFAGPGGYIGINSGLILRSEHEGELASVMAHEIAHVTQRHLYRAYEASKQLSIPATMATIASLLLGFVSPELAQAALIATQAGSIQYQINFTRDNEEEADRVGMQILSQSEYDPRHMVSFFQTLEAAGRLYGNGPPEFLRTHPLTTSRIADAAARAEKFPRFDSSDALSYELIKIKLELAEEESDKQSKSTEIELGREEPKREPTKEQRLAMRYKQVLTDFQNKRYTQAREGIKVLLGQFPRQLLFVSTLADIEKQSGNLKEAAQLMKSAYQAAPKRLSSLLDYAQILVETNQAEQARELLQLAVWDGARLPELFKLLAETYYKQKQVAQAHRYLGEYHLLRGELKQAVTQLRLAGKTAQDNFYMSEIVAEKLRTIRKEIRDRREDS